MRVLEEDITADIQNRSGLEAADRQIRERGKEAKQIKGILCCQSTLLELAGLCDIYNLFGIIVNVCQVKLFQLDTFFVLMNKSLVTGAWYQVTVSFLALNLTCHH